MFSKSNSNLNMKKNHLLSFKAVITFCFLFLSFTNASLFTEFGKGLGIIPKHCSSKQFFIKSVINDKGDDLKNFAGNSEHSDFCENTQSDISCCTSEEQSILGDWWLNKSNQQLDNESRYDNRKTKTRATLSYTGILLANHHQFINAANKILTSEKKTSYCEKSAKAFLDHNLEFEMIKDFQVNSERCLNLTDSYQKELICNSCNSAKQDLINYENGKMGISNNFCKKVESECMDTYKMNLNHVFPYLKALEQLSRCNHEGVKKFSAVQYPIEFEKIDQNENFIEKICPEVVSLYNQSPLLEGDFDFVISLYFNAHDLTQNHPDLKLENYIKVIDENSESSTDLEKSISLNSSVNRLRVLSNKNKDNSEDMLKSMEETIKESAKDYQNQKGDQRNLEDDSKNFEDPLKGMENDLPSTSRNANDYDNSDNQRKLDCIARMRAEELKKIQDKARKEKLERERKEREEARKEAERLR